MTSAHTYHPSHLIDTAPLSARCDYLTQAILAFIAAGHMGLILRYSQKLLRVIRVHNRLTGANVLMRRKRDMLYNSAWRRRVLWGLGGRKKLRRWDEMNARFMPRLETKSAASLNGYGPVDEHPAWLNTPERIAESERLKAKVRNIRRAAVNPHIVRDRVKTDFDGLFRLPPLPRKTRLPGALKIYTQNTIRDYDWNPIPFAKETGFGPACVWPAEFYAAMIADGEMTEAEVPAEATQPSPMCSRNSQSEYPGSPTNGAPKDGDPASGVWYPNPSTGTRKDSNERDDTYVRIVPLQNILPDKTYRTIFDP